MKLILTLVLSLFLSSMAIGNVLRVPKGARVVELIDVVDSSAIRLAQQVDEMSRKSREDIYILINSPGGYISPGFIFVDAIEQAKARGVKIKCVSGVLAASMAFITLAHCNERYVLPNTILLFHPISFSADRVKISEQLPALIETANRERAIEAYLMNAMNMSPGVFYPHNAAETDWTGEGLSKATRNFLTVVDRIEGLEKVFVHQRPRISLFGEIDLIPEAVRSFYE